MVAFMNPWLCRPIQIACCALIPLVLVSCAKQTMEGTPAEDGGDGKAQHRLCLCQPEFGCRVETGALFKEGSLRMVRTRDVVPHTLMYPLMQSGWKGDDYHELALLTEIPPQPEFKLIFSSGCMKSLVEAITDLRWKVDVRTEAEAEGFVELIGGAATRPFFADARGWEVGFMEDPVTKPCTLRRIDFEALGLHDRLIERVQGGFLIRRAFYVPASAHQQCRLIISREFVSSDGFYLFGAEKEVAKGPGCPTIILPDDDMMRQTFRMGITRGSCRTSSVKLAGNRLCASPR